MRIIIVKKRDEKLQKKSVIFYRVCYRNIILVLVFILHLPNYGRKCIPSASYVRVSVYLLNYCLTQVIVYVVQ